MSQYRFLRRTDAWREGEYLDLWSVPHFLSGIALGLVLVFFEFDVRSSFVIGFILLVLYEMFEVIVQIDETRWNRTLDVVVGMVSLTPTVYLAPSLTPYELGVVFAIIAGLDAVLSFFGWRASHKAGVLEKKLRAEYEVKLSRMKDRRARLREQWRDRRRFRSWRRHVRDGAKAKDQSTT